jgi:ABC-type glycerol-3-phosphate transport system substrate-binding protein
MHEKEEIEMKVRSRIIPALVLLLVLVLSVGACGSKELGPITLWSEVNTQSPQTDLDNEFVKVLPGLEEALGTTVNNVVTPYDQLDAKVNLAVQAGGEVPDVTEIKITKLGFHIKNGSLQDITDYVTSSPWYDQVSEIALKTCQGPDGKFYCVPFTTLSRLTYYYTDAYPDGLPATTDELLAAAPALKEQGLFALTGKASEVQGVEVWWWGLTKSFGGSFANADGSISWANAGTQKAIEWTRELVNNGYAPEVILAPGFDDEIPMMNGQAGAFNAGSWSYVWLNPLTTPGGDVIDEGPNSVEVALNTGELGLAPCIAAPGSDPVILVDGLGWGIPVGAENVDGAKAFIDYMMGTTVNVDVSVAWGGMPTIKAGYDDPRYADSAYWKAVIDYMTKYGTPMDPIANYDEAMLKFVDTAIALVQNPSLDIMTELQKAQDEINSK